MNRKLLCSAIAAAALVSLSGAELEHWTFASEKDAKKVECYFNAKNACKVARSFDPAMKPSADSTGSYCFEIVNRGRIFADITPIFVTKHELKKDKRYTLSMLMRASRAVGFRINIAQNYPGWKSAYSYPCKLAAERWQKVTFQFQPAFDLPGKGRSNRAPVLYMGDLPSGTKLWIASVTLTEED